MCRCGNCGCVASEDYIFSVMFESLLLGCQSRIKVMRFYKGGAMIVEGIHWITQILSFTAEKMKGRSSGSVCLFVCLCLAWWSLPAYKLSLYPY